jgi:hypothetical protein
MSIISERRLDVLYQNLIESKSYFRVRSLIDESKNFRGETGERVVFLSHKHDEKTKIEKAIALLRENGIDVYVDWLDEEMPPNTNSFTAKRLKRRIDESDRFMLLATEGAISSKWCNWELGIGDGNKPKEKIAIFPISDPSRKFSGSEYLRIYPYVEEERGVFYVYDPDENSRETLRRWLI